ncbi:MAG: FtsQ-type POTRA domain-containing protein [Actinomycetota bacterium]|nr:FtsQ-type POTRA domain-containing protein [Actinomycetota bacterium]
MKTRQAKRPERRLERVPSGEAESPAGSRRSRQAAAGKKAGGKSRPSLKRVREGKGESAMAGGRSRAGESEARPCKRSRFEWRLLTTALFGAMVLCLAVMLWVYTFTGVLSVKQVEIRGNQRLDAAYLRSISGITSDTHLLKMNVGAVEEAIRSEPYVEKVMVSRSFPNTVILEIVERQPQAAIYQNGKYHLVDGRGYVLESLDQAAQGTVEIKDLDVPLLFPGVEIGGERYDVIMALIESLPEELEGMAEAVGYGNDTGLYMVSGGITVIYGDTLNLPRKNLIALLSLKGLVDKYGGMEYIDVSFPENPVFKPA